MKKALILLLVMALLVSFASLAACSQAEEPPAGGETPTDTENPQTPPAETPGPGTADTTGPGELTEDVLAASKPNEYVPEKLAAGMEVMVAADLMSFEDMFYIAFSDGLKAELEALGYTYIASAFEFDVSVQLEHIENYLTMGVACIIATMVDPNAGIELSAMCEEKGCYLVQQGSIPDGHVSAAVNVDQVRIGTAQGEMASAWIDQTYPDAGPDELHVAFLGNTNNSDSAVRTAALEDYIATDPRFNYVYHDHGSTGTDAAFTAIQNAFTYDPEIKIVFTFNVTQAIGANNYITSLDGVNLAEYGVFCGGTNADAVQMIEQAATNDGSVIRGTIAFGGANPYEGVLNATLGLFRGTYECGVVILEPDWSINSFGYEYSSET